MMIRTVYGLSRYIDDPDIERNADIMIEIDGHIRCGVEVIYDNCDKSRPARLIFVVQQRFWRCAACARVWREPYYPDRDSTRYEQIPTRPETCNLIPCCPGCPR